MRVTVELSEAAVAALRALATARGVSLTDALEAAIGTESWLRARRQAGLVVCLSRPGSRELVALVWPDEADPPGVAPRSSWWAAVVAWCRTGRGAR